MKALTRLSAALASSLPMASSNLISGRSDSVDAAPPTPVCRRISTKKPMPIVAMMISGETIASSRSSRCWLRVRGSTSTPTSAKPCAALRSASLSSAVPAQPSAEQPGTLTLALAPFFSVYSTRPGWPLASATVATWPSSAALMSSDTLRWFFSHASGAFSNCSISGLLRASVSRAASCDSSAKPATTSIAASTATGTRELARTRLRSFLRAVMKRLPRGKSSPRYRTISSLHWSAAAAKVPPEKTRSDRPDQAGGNARGRTCPATARCLRIRMVEFSAGPGRKVTRKPQATRYIEFSRSTRDAETTSGERHGFA